MDIAKITSLYSIMKRELKQTRTATSYHKLLKTQETTTTYILMFHQFEQPSLLLTPDCLWEFLLFIHKSYCSFY